MEAGQEPIAFRIRDGVAGPARSIAQKGASASAMALAMAGKATMAPATPPPFTPSGLVVQRVPLKPRSREGRSSARGIA